MTVEIVSVSFTPQILSRAQDLADLIEQNIAFNPLAVSLVEKNEEPSLWSVIVYLVSYQEATQLQKLFSTASPAAQIETIGDYDWVSHSLKGLPPISAGRFFLYGHHHSTELPFGGVPIAIEAGLAFGTGHHSTTKNCLLAFDHLLKFRCPRSVLDIGTGTGILAIAAAKTLKSSLITASDIDRQAVQIACENARMNGVEPLIDTVTAPGLHHPTLLMRAPYDLIFANILARPLVELAQSFKTCLMKGGFIILSGLTYAQKSWVLAAYRNRGFYFVKGFYQDNWATLLLTNSPL